MRNPKIEITPRQEKYLRDNANRMTNQEMADNLKVSITKISNWLTELGIVKTRVTGPKKNPVSFNPNREQFYNPKTMLEFPYR